MISVFTILFIVIIGFGSHFFARDDNQTEEVAEEALEETLHLPEGSIDFTPESEEE